MKSSSRIAWIVVRASLGSLSAHRLDRCPRITWIDRKQPLARLFPHDFQSAAYLGHRPHRPLGGVGQERRRFHLALYLHGRRDAVASFSASARGGHASPETMGNLQPAPFGTTCKNNILFLAAQPRGILKTGRGCAQIDVGRAPRPAPRLQKLFLSVVIVVSFLMKLLDETYPHLHSRASAGGGLSTPVKERSVLWTTPFPPVAKPIPLVARPFSPCGQPCVSASILVWFDAKTVLN